MKIKRCPLCGGDGMPMGSLGNRQHFRCRACGIEFSRQIRRRKKKEAKS